MASLVIRLHLGFVFLNKGILELGRFMVYDKCPMTIPQIA